jgi:hypothetical protein
MQLLRDNLVGFYPFESSRIVMLTHCRPSGPRPRLRLLRSQPLLLRRRRRPLLRLTSLQSKFETGVIESVWILEGRLQPVRGPRAEGTNTINNDQNQKSRNKKKKRKKYPLDEEGREWPAFCFSFGALCVRAKAYKKDGQTDRRANWVFEDLRSKIFFFLSFQLCGLKFLPSRNGMHAE